MKYILLALSVICFLHVFRDYLQIKGVRNKFTSFGHFWHAPKYEMHGMVILTILGILFLMLSFMN